MICISIQCEEAKIPAVAQLLGRLCHPTEKSSTVPACCSSGGEMAKHSEKAHGPERKTAKKLETDTKPPQGSYPANFQEAPVERLKLSDFEDGKGPLSSAQKAEILALKATGMKPKEIAVKMGIPDARKVQGVILQSMRRKTAETVAEVRSCTNVADVANTSNVSKPLNAPQSPVVGGKLTEVQSHEKEPDPATESKPDPLHARIIDLDRQKMTPHTISDILEEELGAVVSEAEIMDTILRHAKGDL